MTREETTRRSFLKTAACGTLALTAPRILHPARDETEKPNIIFVMVDDMGYGDLGCYGQTAIKTPHLDRMAADGTRFTQCYTGSPVCAPCRCILMTGLHSGHCRRRGNRTTAHREDRPARKGLLPLDDGDFTVAEMLREAGYTTGGFGKWGLGNPGTTGTPDRQGFDLFYGYLDQVHAHNYYTDHLYRNAEKEELSGNKEGGKEEYTHDVIAAETFRFIRENKDRPFFCYVPWTIPHGKHVVPSQGEYEKKSWSEKSKNYAAMITRMDSDLGRMFALLEELGIDDKTIVFFTSDNGAEAPFVKTFGSNGPFSGTKRQLYEGGIRVPMIVRWPGRIPAGETSGFVWSLTDFMPTAAALAGIEPPGDLDGKSVLPALLGKKQEAHEFLYWEFHDPFQQAVLLGDRKGIRFGTKEPIRLYDLSADRGETKDIAREHPEIVARMESIMNSEHVDSIYWPLVEHPKKRNRTKK